MTNSDLVVTRDGAVAEITLNRPEKLNALTLDMVADLRRLEAELGADDTVRVVLITGAGDRAFCAGGDLRTLLPAALEAGTDVLNPDPAARFFSRLFKPVVAAVEGVCFGGGLELMLGTDIRIVSANATFAAPEVQRGLIAGSGTNVRLPRQIPWAIAMELLLLGESIDAARAYEAGLVNRVVPAGRALDEARRLAGRIADRAPLAVQTAKQIAVRSADLTPGFALEHALNAVVLRSDDAREGVASYLEKREPRFTGR